MSIRAGHIITDVSIDGNTLLKNNKGEFDAFARTLTGLEVGVVKNIFKSGEFKVKWLKADGSQYGEEYITEVPFGAVDNWVIGNFIDSGLQRGVVKAIVTYCGNEYIFNFTEL
jgi:hypothetical protein